MKVSTITLVFIVFDMVTEILSVTKNNTKKDAQRSAALPPCAACTVLTDSFEKVRSFLLSSVRRTLRRGGCFRYVCVQRYNKVYLIIFAYYIFLINITRSSFS